jgi:hypothetical protein
MLNRLFWILIIFLVLVGWFFYWTFIYLPNKQAEEDRIRQEQELQAQSEAINLVQVSSQIPEEITENVLNDEVIEEGILSYKTISIWNDVFNFYRWDFRLEMKMNWWDSMYFDLVPEDKIEVKKVYSSDDFLIVIWNDKFLYFSPSSSARVELNIPVNYVKRIGNLFLFNTEKWIFVYDDDKITGDTIEYVDIFPDFVYYNDWYVWILKSSDTRRIKNLWFNLSS